MTIGCKELQSFPPLNIVELVLAELSREYYMQEEVTRRAEEIFRRIPIQRTP
jgi:hypothetical protein